MEEHLKFATEKGYIFVTVQEMLTKQFYQDQNTFVDWIQAGESARLIIIALR